jgi:hypothetical protein
MMGDQSDRYGENIAKLIDSQVTGKEFEFDQILLMPTAKGYRALVEQAEKEISPRIMNYLKSRWSKGTIENLSSFAMAAAVYSRSISDPPYEIDVGVVLLKTVAFCNLRCTNRDETGGGCRIARNMNEHHLPRCIKLPRDITIIWDCIKIYIATGRAVSAKEALSAKDARKIHEAMSVKVDIGHDFYPDASC